MASAKPYVVDVRTVVAGGVALVAAGAIVALFLWMVAPAAARESRAACAGLRPVLNNPALCPQGETSCRLPQPAPDFQVTAHDGKTVSLSQFRGKVVFVNFWASWCNTCKAEKPSLKKMTESMVDDDYAVVTLASDTEWSRVLVAMAQSHNPAKVPEALKGMGRDVVPTMAEALSAYGAAMPQGAPYQVYLDPPQSGQDLGEVARRWGITGVPETFLVDRVGRIRYYFTNKRDWSASVAQTCIRSLIDE